MKFGVQHFKDALLISLRADSIVDAALLLLPRFRLTFSLDYRKAEPHEKYQVVILTTYMHQDVGITSIAVLVGLHMHSMGFIISSPKKRNKSDHRSFRDINYYSGV